MRQPTKHSRLSTKNSTFAQIFRVDNIKKVWVFASGSGSNAERLFTHFNGHPRISVTGLLCNNAGAGVLQKAEAADVPVFLLDNVALETPGELLALLLLHEVDYIILAGFLRKIPYEVVHTYTDRIINIHPALLPRFGGKGMYGMRVHKAVKESGAAETGITVHLVNEHYDEGRILSQASVSITPADTPEDIANKVQDLEHRHFGEACERYILSV